MLASRLLLLGRPKPILDLDFTGSVSPLVLSNFIRATTANDFQIGTANLVTYASGTPMQPVVDPVSGANWGLGIWRLAANVMRRNRDFSNAQWVKTSVTAALDQTGIDGAANSASSLLATGNGGTAVNTITSGAAARCFAIYMKRITGTGTVTIAVDAVSQEISGQINSLTWTRVPSDVGSLNEATATNPVVTITLGTSGDKIAVDYGMVTAGFTPAPPIPTVGASVTVNADQVAIPLTSIPRFNPLQFTCVVTYTMPFLNDSDLIRTIVEVGDGTANNLTRLFRDLGTHQGGLIRINSIGGGSNSMNDAINFNNLQGGGTHTVAFSYDQSIGQRIAMDGSPEIVGGILGTPNNALCTTLFLGSRAGSTSLNGYIKRLRLYTGAAAGAALSGLSARA